MSLLIVSHDANLGGAQSVLLNIMAWIKKNSNLKIKCLCLSRGEGKWLHRFENLGKTLIFDEVSEIIFKNFIKDVNLIYGNTVVAGRIYSFLSQFNLPILTHFHEMELSISYYAKDCIKDTLKYSDFIIACSEPVKSNLIKNYQYPEEKIMTVYASTVPSNITFLSSNEKYIKREKENMLSKFCILGCGIGLAFRKGVDIFINIARELQKIRKDFHFYWIGDFALEEKFETTTFFDELKKIKEEELPVTFLGFCENPKEILLLADLFILPSREDPFPLVCLEAAECELPVICFEDSGGMSEFVKHNCGFTIPKNNISLFANKIDYLLNNEKERKELGKNAKQNYFENYTIEKTTPKILNKIRETNQEKVFIILPNYNHGKYLDERINSIIKQTYKNWELVILDDCSNDNSIEIIKKYLIHPNINLIQNKTNSGSVFKMWIQGLELIKEKSELIWIAEADDSSDPEFLQTLIPFFNDNKVKLAYSDSYIIDENSKIIGNYLETDYLSSLSKTKWKSDYILKAKDEIQDGLGIKNTILNASSMIFRNFDISEIRNDLLKMKLAGDWYFEINTILNGKIAYSSKRLNYHRRHNNSVFGKNDPEKYKILFQEIKFVHDFILKKIKINYDFKMKMINYVIKQCQDLNVPINYYPLKVGFMGLKESQNENIETILEKTGNNTGNLLFFETSKKLISNDIYDLNENVDILFFTCANWLSEKTDLTYFADLIIKKDIPCICIGLGAQSESEDLIPQLKEGTLKFLTEISKRTPYILVRGEFSKKVCEFYGIKNVKIGACPSIFLNDDLKLGEKLEKLYINSKREKILFNMDLNRSLNIDKKYNYILQNEKYLMKIVNNEFVDDKTLLHFMKNMKFDNKDEMIKHIQEKFHYFSNLKDWGNFLIENKFDWSRGNRMHGTIMAISNYIPSICETIDTRTRELSKSLYIPSYDNIKFNGNKFDENRKYLSNLYKKLFEEVGLKTSDKLNIFQ